MGRMSSFRNLETPYLLSKIFTAREGVHQEGSDDERRRLLRKQLDTMLEASMYLHIANAGFTFWVQVMLLRSKQNTGALLWLSISASGLSMALLMCGEAGILLELWKLWSKVPSADEML